MTTTTRTRSALHCYLDQEPYDDLAEFAAEHGVSITGLCQAFAGHIDTLGPALLAGARRVDGERRNRQR